VFLLRASVVLAGVLAMAPARASYFEFCDLAGTVQSVSLPDPAKPRDVQLTVAVDGAARAKKLGNLSYTDCTEHVGATLEAWFEIPPETALPAAGDRIAFSRSVVDGFDKDGNFTGSSIRTDLVELRPAPPAHP
jgi:hypothetical protein